MANRYTRSKAAEADPSASSAQLKNIHDIMGLERETREARSKLERATDWVSDMASSRTFIVVHVVWFAIWISANSLGYVSFDRYPFNFLTLAVSLEAIVLTGFVLMAQDRMTRQADKRAHLDLQINLLAEQELTAILKVQCRLAEKAGVDISDVDPRLPGLLARTDVHQLAETIESEMDSATAPHPPGKQRRAPAG